MEASLDNLDFDAIADPFDKIEECQYFLDRACGETDLLHFRWLISAFLSSAYSFFDISVLYALRACTDPKTGNPVEDVDAVKILERYVTIQPTVKKVTTGGYHEVTKQLYALRKRNTHHHPLSIMVKGHELPDAFCFGYISNQGVPALQFCQNVMAHMRQLHQEIST